MPALLAPVPDHERGAKHAPERGRGLAWGGRGIDVCGLLHRACAGCARVCACVFACARDDGARAWIRARSCRVAA